MPRVLVIGSTGYLGLAIAQQLRLASHPVYGVTRTTDKAPLLASNEITPVIGSVESLTGILSAIEEHNIDVIIDSSPTYDGAAHLIRAILPLAQKRADAKLPKLGYVYISGMWIHGDSPKPVNDLSKVTTETAPKMLAWRPAIERMILDARDVLDVAIMRPALMYGKNQSAWGAYWGQILGGMASASVTLPAKREISVALVHVDDCAAAVCAAVEKLEFLSGTYPVFDLVAHYENMGFLLDAAAVELGFKGKLEYAGPGEDVFFQAMCSIVRGESSRAKILLGWVPKKRGMGEEIEVHVAAFLGAAKLGQK